MFVVEWRADGTGAMAAPLTHLLRAEAGRLVFGVGQTHGSDLGLVAKGLPGSQLRRVPTRMLAGGSSHDADAGAHGSQRPRTPAGDAVLAQIDVWIEELSATVAGDLETRPAPDVRLVAGGPATGGGTVSAERGVVWLTGSNLDATFLGTELPSPEGPDLMAVTAATWVNLPGSVAATVTSSAELARQIGVGRLIDTALAEFHRLAVGAMALNRRLLMADRANLRRSITEWRRLNEARARRGLRSVVRGALDGPPLVVALRAVARHAQVTVRVPPRPRGWRGSAGIAGDTGPLRPAPPPRTIGAGRSLVAGRRRRAARLPPCGRRAGGAVADGGRTLSRVRPRQRAHGTGAEDHGRRVRGRCLDAVPADCAGHRAGRGAPGQPAAGGGRQPCRGPGTLGGGRSGLGTADHDPRRRHRRPDGTADSGRRSRIAGAVRGAADGRGADRGAGARAARHRGDAPGRTSRDPASAQP